MASESPDALPNSLPSTGPAQPASRATAIVRRIYVEIGLKSLFSSPLDIKLLILQRVVRLLAYGMSTLVFIPFLGELGFSPDRVGLFQTLTLIFDVVISWMMTMIADSVGRRATLALGSVMLCGSGVVFALSSNYWVLLAAAVLGIITPSGNEIGPFRAIEESVISWRTPKAERSDIFAWYTLLGMGGLALGTVTAGGLVNLLKEQNGSSTLRAHRTVYTVYAVLGIVKLILAILLSRKCEAESEPQRENSETAPLLADANGHPPKPKKMFTFLPSISRGSIPIVVKLSLLFSLETFGSSLVSLTWTEYYFMWKFDVSYETLGWIFFSTIIIASSSVLVASSIAKRFGNVKTMAFTHLPSSILLGLIPVAPVLPLALTFLVLRSLTQSMDVAPRSAFLAAIIPPNERTAINGFLNVVKTASGAGGPTVTGFLVKHGYFWVAFVTAATLKSLYDIGLLVVFASTESEREHEVER